MKSLVILTLSGLLACAGVAKAADTDAAKKGDRKGFPGIEQRMDMMKKQLDLTPDQETKVKSLFEQEAKDMRGAREEMAKLTPEQRREKTMSRRKDIGAKMKEILTADQLAKWEKARQRRATDGASGEKKGKHKKQE